MSIRWREEGATALVVEQRGRLAVRLFGLPFLLVGGSLLYQFADGVWNRDLTIAGWIGLPLVTACFLVPGWIMVFARKRTRLDLAERAATEELDFLLFHRRRKHAVPSQATVRVRYELRRIDRENRTHLFCPVELAVGPEENVLVAELDGKESEEALRLGERVAGFLGLRVEDLRQKDGEVIEEAGAGEDP
jgi:hypothetical protein